MTLPSGFGRDDWNHPKEKSKKKKFTLKVKHLLLGGLIFGIMVGIIISTQSTSQQGISSEYQNVNSPQMKGDLPKDYVIGETYVPKGEHIRDECKIALEFKNDYWLNNCQ